MEQSLISIITVTRNRGALLKRCIDSVLGQTYQNIEHIIVDGASTDNTDEVIASYSDKRLIYIKLETNLSVPESVYIGFTKSKGKYITFLDSDDEYLPTKIEKQYQLIENLPNDYGMVYCWMSYYNHKTNKFLKIHNPQLRGFVGNDTVEKPVVTGTPSFFIKRFIFQELGGWRNNIGIISDWEFSARLCQKWKIDYVPESLVNVYINHQYQRMSDSAYYSNYCQNSILFHNHFLHEFNDIFEKYPKKKKYHLEALVNNYFYTSQYKAGWEKYFELLKIGFSFKNLIRPFYVIFRKKIYKI